MLSVHQSVKYFALYSIVLFVITTILITIIWHEDNSLTLSKHISKHKAAYFLFAIVSTIGQSMFFVYMLGWFIPFFHLSWVFILLAVFGSIFQLTAAWIPDTKGASARIHHYAAYGMAYTMYGFTLAVALSPTISTPGRLFGLVSFIIMTGLYWFFLSRRKTSTMFFVAQNLYLLLFYGCVLVSGYIR